MNQLRFQLPATIIIRPQYGVHQFLEIQRRLLGEGCHLRLQAVFHPTPINQQNKNSVTYQNLVFQGLFLAYTKYLGMESPQAVQKMLALVHNSKIKIPHNSRAFSPTITATTQRFVKKSAGNRSTDKQNSKPRFTKDLPPAGMLSIFFYQYAKKLRQNLDESFCR